MKKLITVLGLLLIPLGIANAGFTRQFDLLTTVKTVGGNSTVYNTNSYFRANSNGTLYTSYLGSSKPVFYTYYDNSGNKRFWLFYWDNNGLPYLYSYSKYNSWELNLQGNFTKYQLCNYISSVPNDSAGNDGPSGCTTLDVGNGFSEFLGTFFSSIVPSDKYYYRTDFGVSNNWINSNFNICFSNSSLEQSICFTANGRTGTNVEGFINTSLVNSVGYLPSIDFASLNISENKPGNINNTNTTPPTQYTCPTAQQLINTYPEQYNTGLCYSSNIIYSGGTIQTVTPKTIFELYPTRTELNQDVQNYNAYCNNATTTQACQTIFEGKTEEYTLIAKIPQNVMPMQLYTYCNLKLNMDPNQTTCTTSTGTINNGISMDDIIDNIGNSPITVISPGTPPEEEGNGTGSVFDKYTQQEEDTNRRNIIQKAEDTIQTMREIYAKLTGIFRARQGRDGIIPPLITGLIALIVLYKLFKK